MRYFFEFFYTSKHLLEVQPESARDIDLTTRIKLHTYFPDIFKGHEKVYKVLEKVREKGKLTIVLTPEYGYGKIADTHVQEPASGSSDEAA
jgi:hypothetical protein